MTSVTYLKIWACGVPKQTVAVHRPEIPWDSRGVGYLSGSNEKGHGFTVWVPDEESYQHLRGVVGGDR
jgi:hypothetical protein